MTLWIVEIITDKKKTWPMGYDIYDRHFFKNLSTLFSHHEIKVLYSTFISQWENIEDYLLKKNHF